MNWLVIKTFFAGIVDETTRPAIEGHINRMRQAPVQSLMAARAAAQDQKFDEDVYMAGMLAGVNLVLASTHPQFCQTVMTTYAEKRKQERAAR